MASEAEMDHPVTRRELHAELAAFEERLEQRLEQKLEQKIDAKLGSLERRFDHKLELLQGALVDRIGARETRMERLERLPERLAAELARSVRAANEEMRDWMRAFEDRYRDLPPRVDRLETKVFAPKRRRR